jgi:hypothetical protein
MTASGGTRNNKGKKKVGAPPPIDTATLSIFTPAPIDRDFVPYSQRPILRLIEVWDTIAVYHIFPYIILNFVNNDFHDADQTSSPAIPIQHADSNAF